MDWARYRGGGYGPVAPPGPQQLVQHSDKKSKPVIALSPTLLEKNAFLLLTFIIYTSSNVVQYLNSQPKFCF